MTQDLLEIPFQSSTLETIDWAIYNWLNEEKNLSVETKDGFKKVEVVWVSAERSWLAKKTKEGRESAGALVFPLITIERKSTVKDLQKKGNPVGNVPLEPDHKGGSSSIVIARRIKQDKTSNFANADSKRFTGQINFPRKNKKIVYETVSVPMPVYIEATYEVKIRTLFQSQMNDLLTPFYTQGGGINYLLIKHEGHRFEAFIENFSHENNASKLGSEERKFESTFSVRVLGHLIGAGPNDEQPKVVVRENAVEIKIPREQVIFGDLTPDGREYSGLGGLGSVQKGRKD